MSAPTASFIVCGTKFEVDAKYKLTRPIGTGAPPLPRRFR
jgi:hypothetical protein